MTARAAGAAALGALLLMAAMSGAQAQWLERWTRARQAASPPAHRFAAPHAPLQVADAASAVARLRLEKTPTRYRAWADNRLPGPVQVELRAVRSSGVVASPALPVRMSVPARGSVLLATLILADAQAAGDFQLQLDAVPGEPGATPLQVRYQLPFAAPVRVDQGPGGHFSHDDAQNRDAVDFALPEGTPVLAARDGVVLQVEAGFDRAGLDREAFAGRSNFVRILHGDGSMALYAHLQPDGVLVRPGQSVRAGQRIGRSGNTGFSSAPHLHFVVQVNAGMGLVSVPFALAGPLGTVHLPR